MAFALDRWCWPVEARACALAPGWRCPAAGDRGWAEQDAEQAAFIRRRLRPSWPVMPGVLPGKLLWPVGLAPTTGAPRARKFGSAWGYSPDGAHSYVLPVAAPAPAGSQGAGVAFAAGLLPVLGLVPFASDTHVADRYAYLAPLAPALVLAWAPSRAHRGGPALTVLALCLLAGASAFRRCRVMATNAAGRWRATRKLDGAPQPRADAATPGQEEDARAHYGAALRLRPDAPETLVNLGYLAELRGDAAGARAHYDEAIRHQPDYPAARVNLAALLTRLGQYEEAISHCRHALRVQPDFTDAHLNLAVALDARGESSAAIPHAQAAARLQPRNAKIHYTLGNVLLNAGREAEAVHSFRRALALRPEYTEARVNLAVTLGKLGQTEESIREYEHVLRLEPAFGQVRYNLGLLLEEQGRWAEAVEQYRAVLREAPGFTGVRLRLAQVLERLGQTAEAAALRRSVPGKGMEKTGEPATHAR